MRIETYELLAEVEQTFGVANAYNGRADTFDTVGDLYRYILQNRRPRPSVACLTASTFYRVRRGLMAALRVPKEQVRPNADIEAMLPSHGRRDAWCELQSAIGLKLPDLEPSLRVFKGAFVIGLVIWPLIAMAAWASEGLIDPISAVVLTVGYPVLYLGAALFVIMGTTSLHTEFPYASDTVAGLTRAVIKENWGSQALQKGNWDDQDVWNDLVSLIEEWGYPRDHISEQTRFLTDLGAYTL